MARMTREARVRMAFDGASEMVQDLDKIRGATEDFGDAGVKSANSLVNGFENVEKGASRVSTKITQGRKVSDSELEAMQQQYGLLTTSIEKTFGSLEEAPEEIQKAFERSRRQVEFTASKVDDMRKGMEKLAQASRQTEKTSVTGFENVDTAIERVKKTTEAYNTKLQQDANVSKSDIDNIARAQVLLRQEMERSGVSMDRLGDEGREALRSIEQGAADARKSFLEMESAIDASNTEIKNSIKGFSGLDDLFKSLPGGLGKTATSFGTVTAALSAGWAMGQKLNQLFGTDMQEWESLTETFGKKTKAVFENLSDVAVSAAGVVVSKFGDESDAQFAAEDFASTWQKTSETLSAAFTKNGAEFDAYIDNLKGKLPEAAQKQIDAVRAIIEKLKEERDQRGTLSETMKDELATRGMLLGIMDRALAVAKMQEDVEKNGVTPSLNETLDVLNQLVPAYDKNRLTIGELVNGSRTLVNTSQTMTKAKREEVLALLDQIERYEDLELAEKGGVQMKLQYLDTQRKATEQTSTTKLVLDKTTRSISQAATELGEAAKSGDQLAISWAQCTTDAHLFNTELQGINEQTAKLPGVIVEIGEQAKKVFSEEARGTFTDFGESVKPAVEAVDLLTTKIKLAEDATISFGNAFVKTMEDGARATVALAGEDDTPSGKRTGATGSWPTHPSQTTFSGSRE